MTMVCSNCADVVANSGIRRVVCSSVGSEHRGGDAVVGKLRSAGMVVDIIRSGEVNDR